MMTGATTIVLFLFAMTSLLEAGQLRSCVEEDVCSAIIFNQLTIATMKDDMRELVQAFNNTRNSGEMVQKKELSDCHIRNKHLKKQILSLERTTQTRNEVLEEENHRLQQVIIQKDKLIKNLTILAYKPVDCAEIQIQGRTESGIYTIYPYQTEESIDVLCDLDSHGGGWTVFFTRQPQDQPLDFNESWEKFKKGFGNLNTEYWLGNDLIHALTSHATSTLRLDAEIFSGERRWAEWNVFNIGDEESKYEMTLEEYEVTSTMGDSLSQNSNSSFSTFDNDNDERTTINCVLGTPYAPWGKGGWWYKGCGNARLTAPLKNSNKWDSSCWQYWDKEGKSLVSLKVLSMKFRRHNYEERLPRE